MKEKEERDNMNQSSDKKQVKSRLAFLNEDEAAELIAGWLFDLAKRKLSEQIKIKKAAAAGTTTA
ncbi:hypothetical protein ACLOAU_14405 [Niabella sp. CJ426]|uniref:hypothetical protein n=1 Tax=Niabella sp. CJ426 TaxID=3393740 RepID=UPI003D00C71F